MHLGAPFIRKINGCAACISEPPPNEEALIPATKQVLSIRIQVAADVEVFSILLILCAAVEATMLAAC
jgi:hypothetical protein